ncbi:MAG: hypothetical protein HQ481_21665 [Alphaproteobacteria bacterium]|nr:hypothetical protein [Alphaproteobacteria bacterium]
MTEVALLAGIGPIHPDIGEQRVLLEDTFVEAGKDLVTADLRLTLTTDMEHFTTVVQGTGKFLPTAFDRRLKPFRDGDTLGLVVRDGEGVVSTLAIRLYRFSVTTLADHLATLSLFYANPAEQMVRGERLIIEGQAEFIASTVEDSAIYVGGFWIRSDYRGRASNLSYFMPLMVRALGAARWGRHPSFSLMKRWITDPRRSDRVGAPDVYDRITWIRPHVREDQDLVLMMTPPKNVFERVENYLSGSKRLWVGDKDPNGPDGYTSASGT